MCLRYIYRSICTGCYKLTYMYIMYGGIIVHTSTVHLQVKCRVVIFNEKPLVQCIKKRKHCWSLSLYTFLYLWMASTFIVKENCYSKTFQKHCCKPRFTHHHDFGFDSLPQSQCFIGSNRGSCLPNTEHVIPNPYSQGARIQGGDGQGVSKTT